MTVEKQFLTWHDRADFELGTLYVEQGVDVTLEYVGVVAAKAARTLVRSEERLPVSEPDEAVLLFLQVEAPGDGLWTHTRLDTNLGFTLQLLADSMRSEIDGRRGGGAEQRRSKGGPAKGPGRHVDVPEPDPGTRPSPSRSGVDERASVR